MQQKTKLQIGGGILFLVLFIGIWKLSAPMRMMQSFKSQMLARLNTASGANTKLERIELRWLRMREGHCVVYYGVIWRHVKSDYLEEVWSECPIPLKNGIYEGKCTGRAATLLPDGSPSEVQISLH